MNRMRTAIRGVFAPAFFAAVADLGLYLYIHHQKMVYVTKPILFGFVGFFSSFVLFSAWMYALSFVPKTRVRAAGYVTLLSIQTGLAFHYILQGGYLDYSLLRNYVVEILSSPRVMALIAAIGGLYLWMYLAAAALVTVLLHRFGVFAKPQPFRGLGLAAFCAASAAFFMGAKNNPNGLYQLARSFENYNPEVHSDLFPAQKVEGYPYLRNFKPSKSWPAGKRRPHVFVVMVESVGARFVEKKAANGTPIMPNWAKYLDAERSYANFFTPSIFTERAHTSVLCSILPSYRKKVMRYYADNSMRCLPSVLNDFGYKTIGFKADERDDFDNEIEFLKKIGFHEAYAMARDTLTEEERQNIWGWGLQDDYFYRRVFRELDRRIQEDPDRPLFTFMATISSHVPFNKMPDALKTLYPNPNSLADYYETSLHIADRFLPVFFEELERRPEFQDALVFIMGDHGIRVGWRDHRAGATTYQNDFFNIPLLVRWKGHLHPGRVRDEAYSLVDIPPTILDWLGMETPVQFIGSPMRRDGAPKSASRILHIIQPYDGMFISALQYPWKYVYSLSDGREFLHDLANDPEEKTNLMGRANVDIRPLRASLQKIFLNQELLQANRIFPPNESTQKIQAVGSK